MNNHYPQTKKQAPNVKKIKKNLNKLGNSIVEITLKQRHKVTL